MLAALPSDSEPGTKIYISVPAASAPFPALVAVKAESIVGNTVCGIKVSSSTALKVNTQVTTDKLEFYTGTHLSIYRLSNGVRMQRSALSVTPLSVLSVSADITIAVK